jgi:hypothetical protein
MLIRRHQKGEIEREKKRKEKLISQATDRSAGRGVGNFIHRQWIEGKNEKKIEKEIENYRKKIFCRVQIRSQTI